MNITIKIEAPELAQAINNLAESLKKPPKTTTTADRKKEDMAEKILSLGGTPPKSGSLKLYENTLKNLLEDITKKEEQEEPQPQPQPEPEPEPQPEPQPEPEPEPQPEPEPEPQPEPEPEPEPQASIENTDADTVRTLASKVSKLPSGRELLLECLGEIKATRFSECDQSQLNAAYPILISYIEKAEK